MKHQARYRVGVDVGGTFTDAVAFDTAGGSLRWAKAPSTPDEPARGVLEAVSALTGDFGAIERFVHGITIGTNAIIERKGADVWVVTTKGFRDTLEIQRTERRELYNIRTLKPASFVPRLQVLEADERMRHDASVLRTLDPAECERIAETLRSAGAESVAVCFLHSFANGAHERAMQAALAAAAPAAWVCTSSEVLPEIREYERFSTTVLNAYIGPLMNRYLEGLESRLASKGFTRTIFLMTSNGGVTSAGRARRLPVQTVLSGPAGGVAASVELGQLLGVENLISCDMGGTSTDVCLVEGLRTPLTTEQMIAGYPNRTPQVEIVTIGAGGGSIAWLDGGETLAVGPRSAGADPGPAAYGRGRDGADGHRRQPRARPAGERDEARFDPRAGRLARPRFTGAARGAVRRDRGARSRRRRHSHRGRARWSARSRRSRLRRDTTPGISCSSPTAGQDRCTARSSPRSWTSITSSSLRAPATSPRSAASSPTFRSPAPGRCWSRPGAANGRPSRKRSRAWSARAVPSWKTRASRHRTSTSGASWACATSASRGSWWCPSARRWTRCATPSLRFTPRTRSATVTAPTPPAEVVTVRVTAVARTAKPALPSPARDGADAGIRTRPVYFDGAWSDTAVLARPELAAGAAVDGPALVEEMGSVTVVPPRLAAGDWCDRRISSAARRSAGDDVMNQASPAVHETASNHHDIDPITLEVVCEGLRAIVKEMRATIIRASFSSVIYELDDFSCALFNPAAEMVAQSDDHPGHVMPMPWSVRCAMEDFEGEIDDGDVIVLNDAYPRRHASERRHRALPGLRGRRAVHLPPPCAPTGPTWAG